MTIEEVSEKTNNWKRFCDMFGWSPHCLAEGFRGDTTIRLTIDQAKELGLI